MTVYWSFLLPPVLLAILGVRALACAESFEQQLKRGPLLDAICCVIILTLALAIVALNVDQREAVVP